MLYNAIVALFQLPTERSSLHSFEYVLIMLGAVLISSLINQQFPKISTPLVQIGLGILLTLLPLHFAMALDPELFLILFIAPLLFEDGKKADKKALWKLKRPILYLALGLVFATALSIGYLVNWIIPSIPLAAAFALAAALAPTDAVAVSSLSKNASLSENQKSILEGESLINDASGVVSFQFAIAAMITGAFSLADASVSFIISFFGGIAVGLVLMVLRYGLVRAIRASGMENITFHVLLEILTPFIVYFFAETIGVSGILAAVTAGISYSFMRRRTDPGSARYSIVSTSAWSVITFALNGLVFLILGTQLPNVAESVWLNAGLNSNLIVLYVFIILFAVMVVRFIWIFIMHRKQGFDGTIGKERLKHRLKDALLMTLSGAKGAITLAVVLTIPHTLPNGDAFPQRDLIVFLASGAIVLSLLIANFVVPLIAPAKKKKLYEKDEVEARIDILRSVLHSLTDAVTSENKSATEAVIRSCNARITRVKQLNQIDNPSEETLRIEATEWEKEQTLRRIQDRSVSTLIGYYYLYQLSRVRARLEHKNAWGWMLSGIRNQLSRKTPYVGEIGHTKQKRTRKERANGRQELRNLQIANYRYVLEKLNEKMEESDSAIEDISTLASEYQRRLTRLEHVSPRSEDRTSFNAQLLEVESSSLQYEREAIQEMYEAGRISHATAKRLRDNVALMELDIEEELE